MIKKEIHEMNGKYWEQIKEQTVMWYGLKHDLQY